LSVQQASCLTNKKCFGWERDKSFSGNSWRAKTAFKNYVVRAEKTSLHLRISALENFLSIFLGFL
jgi:hypothetical protein